MEKNNVKKVVSKVITKAGMKSAKIDVNQACVYVLYQPKAPKQLKHKRLLKTRSQIVKNGVSKTVL